MPAAPYAVSVTTTTRRILSFSTDRTTVVVYNNGTGSIFVGVDASLTTTNGFPIPAGMACVFSREFGDDPQVARFAVCSSNTQDVRISEEYGLSMTSVLMKLSEVLAKK